MKNIGEFQERINFKKLVKISVTNTELKKKQLNRIIDSYYRIILLYIGLYSYDMDNVILAL